MRLIVFFFIMLMVFQSNTADSFTACYKNCMNCQVSDFTQCTVAAFPCVYGYALSGSTCNAVPSFNNYATEFSETNKDELPLAWVSGGSSVVNTLTCNTITQGQTISLIGPFTTQQVSKSYTIAPRSTMFVQLYFLRSAWTNADSVNISIVSNGNILKNEIVTSTSYSTGQQINYLSNCSNGATAAQLFGSQITLVVNGFSNSTSIDIVFIPSVSGTSQWGFSNIKVSTGCGSFMVSKGGTCNSCLSGYYYNQITLDCQKCHPSCNSCYGATNTNCLSCPLQSVLNGNTCVYSTNFIVMNDIFVDQGTIDTTSSCSNIHMLGGPQFGQTSNILNRTYSLPRHMLIKLNFWLVRIGDWSGISSFIAEIDGVPFVTVTDFQTPGISPLCLKQIGPILVSTSQHSSNFNNHNNTNPTLTFRVTGTSNTNTRYGVNGISLVAFNCPPQCSQCVLSSDMTPTCMRCNQFLSQSSGCLICPNGFFLDNNNQYATTCRKCYSTCLQCSGPTQLNCTACFAGFSLQGTYCTPNKSLGYTLYSQELTTNVFNKQHYSTSYGNDFQCGSYQVFGNPTTDPTNITRKWDNLPSHKGLLLNMQLFKLGPWTNSSNITLKLNNNTVISLPVNQSIGSRLCTSGVSDFIYTLSVPLDQHTAKSLNMEVSGSSGLAISNVILTLQNCPDCSKNQFGYEVEYIPKYTLDNNAYGMNTWLKFNQDVQNVNISQLAQNFQLYMNAIPLNVTQWDNINDLRLYTPFPNNYSFVNGTLTILNKDPSQVLSTSNLNIPPQQLTTIRSESKIARYDSLADEDYRIPTNQLYTLMKGYTEAILYIAISLIGLGLGLVCEQFIIVLQLIFMHVYIMTGWLPATLKLPLSGMWRIEHLNYFMQKDINRIQGAILPKGLHQRGPHTFEQYHTDINFVRASYPIVVLNLIYLAYWIIIYILHCAIPWFRKSPNIVVRWFREIVQRPLNFFDYFFRLQFVTVAWSCFCQYRHFYASNVKSFRDFNYFWTILFFVCLCVYPFIMVCYLLRVRGGILKQTFSYRYQDIFFMRIKRNHDQMSSFIYILVRFLRYFIICCFMALFAANSIVGPILCMVMTGVQTVFIIFRSIYVDPFYLIFKLVQNLFLFLLGIIYIIFYASADNWTLSTYLNLGYIADAFIIVLLINASLRALYLLYLKIRVFCGRNYRLDRAYNPASLGYDYQGGMAIEMGLMPGPQKFGVPSRVLTNNVGLGLHSGVIPTGAEIQMMGMGGMGGMNTFANSAAISGGGFGMLPTQGVQMPIAQQMNINQITTIPMGVTGLHAPPLPPFNPSRSTTNIQIHQTHHINQPQFIQYSTNDQYIPSQNIGGLIAHGANNQLGRGSIQDGGLMLSSNIQGYGGNYQANYINPPYQQGYTQTHSFRTSQMR